MFSYFKENNHRVWNCPRNSSARSEEKKHNIDTEYEQPRKHNSKQMTQNVVFTQKQHQTHEYILFYIQDIPNLSPKVRVIPGVGVAIVFGVLCPKHNAM